MRQEIPRSQSTRDDAHGLSSCFAVTLRRAASGVGGVTVGYGLEVVWKRVK
jgi:hypothetical protein